MLEKLKDQVRLSALSNTDALHTQQWAGQFGETLKHLESVYLSHELGKRKPEADCYRTVIEQLGTPAESILFIDDLEENIEGAQSVGLQTLWLRDPLTLSKQLSALGFDSGGLCKKSGTSKK